MNFQNYFIIKQFSYEFMYLKDFIMIYGEKMEITLVLGATNFVCLKSGTFVGLKLDHANTYCFNIC